MSDAIGIDDRITVFEAAELCGVKPVTVRQWVYRGLLPVADRYAGRQMLFSVLDVAKAHHICKTKSRANRQEVIYYVQFGDRIKIGTSVSVLGRLDNVPHDALLAIEAGGRELEQTRHREFTDDRLTGEWFRASDALLAHVGRLRADLAQPVLTR